MSVTALAFVLAASLYTGFQWTIRLVVYPQFATVPVGAFVAYERNHQRLVSIAVGPLFAALGVAALALLARKPAGVGEWVPVSAVVLVGILLGLTAFAAVPLHTRLTTGFEPGTHRRLLAVDAARLVVAGAAMAVGIYALVG